MANTDFQSVDDYIATKPEATQPILARVRSVIRKAIPSAVEGISYQIPAYKVAGMAALYFAGWKEHYSLYPATGQVVVRFGDELAKYKISKGTIRFPLDEPVPVKLIAKIAKLRAQETAEYVASKVKATSRPRSTARAKKGGTKTGAQRASKPTKRAPKKRSSRTTRSRAPSSSAGVRRRGAARCTGRSPRHSRSHQRRILPDP
jgi:uncharacterized protein YdhG (YjbR/CyaY superfamily)